MKIIITEPPQLVGLKLDFVVFPFADSLIRLTQKAKHFSSVLYEFHSQSNLDADGKIHNKSFYLSHIDCACVCTHRFVCTPDKKVYFKARSLSDVTS